MHFSDSAELAEIVRVLSEEKEKADDMDQETSVVFHYGATLCNHLLRCCTCRCRKSKSNFVDDDEDIDTARSQREIRAEIEKAKAEKNGMAANPLLSATGADEAEIGSGQTTVNPMYAATATKESPAAAAGTKRTDEKTSKKLTKEQ